MAKLNNLPPMAALQKRIITKYLCRRIPCYRPLCPTAYMNEITHNEGITDGGNLAGDMQKIYSAELITILGGDYISLDPEHKEILSCIYEQNSLSPAVHLGIGAICSRLWKCKTGPELAAGQEAYQQKLKRIVNSLEKGALIIKTAAKQYKINNEFKSAKNLFN